MSRSRLVALAFVALVVVAPAGGWADPPAGKPEDAPKGAIPALEAFVAEAAKLNPADTPLRKLQKERCAERAAAIAKITGAMRAGRSPADPGEFLKLQVALTENLLEVVDKPADKVRCYELQVQVLKDWERATGLRVAAGTDPPHALNVARAARLDAEIALLKFADQPPVPRLSPNAPPDRPVGVTRKSEAEEIDSAIAPLIEKARKTYPEAKKRYSAGLGKGHAFFVVTKLRDEAGRFEQVFIAVSEIKDGKITGRIASDIRTVKGFKSGDPYTFAEADLVDWLITNPDGSEDGNLVGKFLDEWQKNRQKK